MCCRVPRRRVDPPGLPPPTSLLVREKLIVTRSATCYTVVSLACLVGIPIAGNILASNDGNYWGLILFTGMAYVGSFAALLAAKISAVGWKPWAVF